MEGYENYTILIIDDDKSYRRLLKKIVEERVGAKCIEAENPVVAFEQFSTSIPDLIIIDLLMPVMDGMVAIERMRKVPATAHIPIIACTGVTDKELVMRLARTGVSDYIVKPLNGLIVVDKIKKLLSPQVSEQPAKPEKPAKSS